MNDLDTVFDDELPPDHRSGVVAVVGVAAGNNNSVGPVFECFHQDHKVNTTGTRETDNFNVGRVFNTACPCKVGAGISAPVTYKCHDFRFKFLHAFYVGLWLIFIFGLVKAIRLLDC